MRRLLLLALLGALLGVLLAGSVAAAELSGRVERVYDGDTLVVAGIGEVRLLGIDAPEHEASARDSYYRRRGIAAMTLRRIAQSARRYVRQQAGSRIVTLKTDGSKRDRYGRLLAYVYLPDGRLLNRQLLAEGLAAVYRRFNFSLKQEFLAEEAAARRRGVGLWQPAADNSREQK